MSDTFEGFEFPNTTPVPDIVFDKLLGELTGNELKVLLYIIRRTYGFGKNADAISLSQFREGIVTRDEKVLDHGCGITHNRTILVALNSLEAKGYITSKKRKTTLGDSDITVYKLRFKQSKEALQAKAAKGVVTPHNQGSLPGVTTVVTPGNHGGYSRSRRVVTSGNPQETVLQETDSQHTVLQGEEGDSNNSDGEENSSDSPPELTPTQKLVKRINEIHETYDTAMGFSTTWTKENHEGAEILATQGRTDEEITLAIKDIQDDPDQFDLKRMNLKYLSTIIDGRLNAIRQRQSRPQQQFRSPSPARPPFRKPTFVPASLSPGLDLDAIAARQEQDWLREHGAEFGITPESVEAGATS